MSTVPVDTKFEFDLIFALPAAADEAVVLDSLCKAGCDDAAVGLGAPGLIGLGFTRVGREAAAVISEAIKQVLSALPGGASLREVKPDLVSLAEVAAHGLPRRRVPTG